MQWPENAPGFKEVPIDDHTREMLRYDTGRQATWTVSPVVRPEALDAIGRERPGRLISFSSAGNRARPPSCGRARIGPISVCPRSAGPSSGNRKFGPIRSEKISRCRFSISVSCHDDPGGRPIYAETFFCLREDRVRAASSGEAETLAFSHWSIPERWDVVKKGLRNPGQQVLEFVLLSRSPLSAEEARDKFAALVPELVKEEVRR